MTKNKRRSKSRYSRSEDLSSFKQKDPRETSFNPEDKLLRTSGSGSGACASGQPRVWFLNVVFVCPRPAVAFVALGGVVGICKLAPLRQAGHHVLQLSADDSVVALALSALLVGGISKGGVWRCLGDPSWWGELVLVWPRELEVSLDGGVRQQAAGLRRGVAEDHHGGQLSSVTSQDLLLHVLGLIHGGRLVCWVSFPLLRSQRLTQRRRRSRLALTRGGAGQTLCICRLLSGDLRRGGDGVFKEEGRVEAAVSDARGSASVDRWGLGVQDAELLIKFLRYLTGELNQVAAVEFSISPVKPGREFNSRRDFSGVTFVESRRWRVSVPLPVRACSNFDSINQHKPLVHLPGDLHTWSHVEICTSYCSHPHLLQREETGKSWQTADPPSCNRTWQGHIFIWCHSMVLLCTHGHTQQHWTNHIPEGHPNKCQYFCTSWGKQGSMIGPAGCRRGHCGSRTPPEDP